MHVARGQISITITLQEFNNTRSHFNECSYHVNEHIK